MSSMTSKVLYKILKKSKMNQQLKKELESGDLEHHINMVPSKYLIKRYRIKTDSISNKKIYTFNNTLEKEVLLFYIHGGAYVHGFSGMHFRFFKALIKKTNATIITPDYPLVPSASAEEIYDFLKACYHLLVSSSHYKKVILMGDSAGGGLALGLAQKLYEENPDLKFNLILISPWLDVSMEDESINQLEKIDPILNKDVLKTIGKMFAGNRDLKDSFVSPLYGSLKQTESIAIWTGTNDLLYSDSVRLTEMMKISKKQVKLHLYENMLHTWIFFGIPESQQASKEIFSYIKSI